MYSYNTSLIQVFTQSKKIVMNLQKSHSNSQMTHSNQPTSLSKFYWSAALACTAVIGSILPVKAASVNFMYAPVATVDQIIGHEMTEKYWSKHLAHESSHNILIEPTNALSKNMIGNSTSEVIQATLLDFIHQLWSANSYS